MSIEVLKLVKFSKSGHFSNTYKLNLGTFIPSLWFLTVPEVFFRNILIVRIRTSQFLCWTAPMPNQLTGHFWHGVKRNNKPKNIDYIYEKKYNYHSAFLCIHLALSEQVLFIKHDRHVPGKGKSHKGKKYAFPQHANHICSLTSRVPCEVQSATI